MLPAAAFDRNGKREVRFEVTDGQAFTEVEPFRLLGPIGGKR
ncbi:MAG: hypothetical protein ACI9OJ_001889 [Myxococcota bacterium]